MKTLITILTLSIASYLGPIKEYEQLVGKWKFEYTIVDFSNCCSSFYYDTTYLQKYRPYVFDSILELKADHNFGNAKNNIGIWSLNETIDTNLLNPITLESDTWFSYSYVLTLDTSNFSLDINDSLMKLEYYINDTLPIFYYNFIKIN